MVWHALGFISTKSMQHTKIRCVKYLRLLRSLLDAVGWLHDSMLLDDLVNLGPDAHKSQSKAVLTISACSLSRHMKDWD